MILYAYSLKITQMCFNEPHYIILHFAINIMAENHDKGRTKGHNNVSKRFLSIICWKRVVTSTQ